MKGQAWVLVIVVAGMAGCMAETGGTQGVVASPSGTAAGSSEVVAPTTSAAPATGAAEPGEGARIFGLVTDDELAPIPNATVRLADNSLQTLTDAAGGFEMLEVPAGSYEIIAEAVGHGSVALSVDAVPGESTEVKFQLQALAVSTEYHLTRILKGYMECSVFFVAHFNLCDGLGKDQTSFPITTTPEVKEAIAEVVWTPTIAGTAAQFDVELWGGGEAYYTWHDSPSPLVMRRSDLPVGKYDDFRWAVGVGSENLLCQPNCPGPYPPVAYQQSFTLYESVCYGVVCAPEHQVRP